VTGGVGGTGEGSVKVEDAIDIKEEGSVEFEAVYIKDEIPETSTFFPISCEHEVRFKYLFLRFYYISDSIYVFTFGCNSDKRHFGSHSH
jgi:uncharacterized protein (DUF2235 family)